MPSNTTAGETSRLMLWTGRVISALPALALLLDGVMKLVQPAQVVEATTQIGFPQSAIMPLGIVLVVSTLLYLYPRTAVLGAILLTGYLGGAVAAHVRMSAPLLTQTLVPVYFGAVIWLGLVLRDARLRSLLPLRLDGR